LAGAAVGGGGALVGRAVGTGVGTGVGIGVGDAVGGWAVGLGEGDAGAEVAEAGTSVPVFSASISRTEDPGEADGVVQPSNSAVAKARPITVGTAATVLTRRSA